MIKYSLPFLLSLSLISCSSERDQEAQSTNREFDLLCDEFTIFVSSDNYTSMNSEERAYYFDQMAAHALEPNSNAYLAWTAIRNATPSARSALFDEAAYSSGYEEWKCPALEQHAHEVGSGHD